MVANVFMIMRCVTCTGKWMCLSEESNVWKLYVFAGSIAGIINEQNLIYNKSEMEIVMNQQRKKIHPHKFTLWVAIASILMMFAGLTSAFIVKSNLAGWKNIVMPKIFWFSTAVIVSSSLTMQMAVTFFPAKGNEAVQNADRVDLCSWELFSWYCNGLGLKNCGISILRLKDQQVQGSFYM